MRQKHSNCSPETNFMIQYDLILSPENEIQRLHCDYEGKKLLCFNGPGRFGASVNPGDAASFHVAFFLNTKEDQTYTTKVDVVPQ